MVFNLKLNNLESRVKTYNLGLSNINDKIVMFEPKFTGSSGTSFRQLHRDEGPHLEFKVKVKKLDGIKMPKVDLMKIDVEGSEYNVFLGAKKTIISSKPTILVELLNKWMKPFGHKPQDLVSALINLDYICFAIAKGKLREISVVDGFTEETNFIFCHRSKIKHMKYLYTLVA
jgi:FkbM family methyltransferase